MPDIVVKIYLYFLIGSSVILFLLYGIILLFERYYSRQLLVKRKHLWRNLFSLITGIAGYYFFTSRLLGNSAILLITSVLILFGTIAAELIERARKSTIRHHRYGRTNI